MLGRPIPKSSNFLIKLASVKRPLGCLENFCCAVIGYDYNAQNGSDCDGLFLLIDHGLSYARFMEHRDNNPWTSLDGDPGAYLRFTLTYFVA